MSKTCFVNVCNRYRAQNGLDKKSIKSFTSKKVMDSFLPIMELLFNLPGQGPIEGTLAWVHQQIQNIDRVSFYLMSKDPALLKAYIKREVLPPSTDDQGYVMLHKDEEIPDGHYSRVHPSERLPTHTYSK